MSVLSKNETSTGERKIGIQYESANKRSLSQYHQNTTNEQSKTFTKNEKKHDFDENKIPNRRRANKIYLTRNTQTTFMCP